MPVYNVEEKWLAACVSSLQNQYYENWELCLADDASPSEHIKPMLEKYKELINESKLFIAKKTDIFQKQLTQLCRLLLAILLVSWITMMN